MVRPRAEGASFHVSQLLVLSFTNHFRVCAALPDGRESLTEINSTHRLCTPLTYSLLFPWGEEGWEIDNILYDTEIDQGAGRRRAYVTELEHFRYRLFERDDRNEDDDFRPSTIVHDSHLHHGRLSQQWAVDQYVSIETHRLNWVQQHQKEIRADLYKEVQAAMAADELGKVGRHVVLPSSFRGGPRDLHQRYEDDMAMVRTFGKPDLFITLTCNPS